MKAELQKKLVSKYPEFFQYLQENETPMIDPAQPVMHEVNKLLNQEKIVLPMQFGFECGDGWYWLLDQLMDTIYSYCKNNNKPVPHVSQIKEKWGGLCFYAGGDQMIHGMIWLAEHMSYGICETCGTNRHVGQTEGWVYTICEECREKNPRAKELPFKLHKI